ncbi:uncharacterized protein METZ01_LOCUS493719 [marine metagenome]|uniref:Uncharacterized protein n=1 Tax=marine metagenome TaxID=408172 RepID=A0A383D9D2_9ZZZZ
MADIHAFLDRVLIEGLQRTNRYRCKLDLTQFGNFAAGRRLTANLPKAAALLREGLLCRTSMTPSRTLETTNVNLAGGYEETYAVGTTYNNLDCTFLCPLIDDTNQVLTLFHAWQNLIQNRGKVGEDANMVLTFPSEYRLEQGLRVELFSGQADRESRMTQGPLRDVGPEITTAFEYFDVYPVTVSGTTVDWLTLDEMMEVAVTFSYTHWQQVKDGDLNS